MPKTQCILIDYKTNNNNIGHHCRFPGHQFITIRIYPVFPIKTKFFPKKKKNCMRKVKKVKKNKIKFFFNVEFQLKMQKKGQN